MTTQSAHDSQEPSHSLLRIEYACTPQELEEAQNLSIRHQVAGGSKWLTHIILLGLLVIGVGALWYKISHELPAGARPYSIVAVVALFAFQFFRLRRRKQKQAPHPTVVIEFHSAGFKLVGASSQALIPWQSFNTPLESKSLFILRDRAKLVLYVIPKRVLPSPDWVHWLKNAVSQPNNQQPAVERPSTVHTVSPDSNITRHPSDVVVEYRLGFWNYLDLTAASWLSRLFSFGWFVMVIGAFFYVSSQPLPQSKVTAGEVFLYLALPGGLGGALVLIPLMAAQSWMNHKKVLLQTTVFLSEAGITFNSHAGTFSAPWTVYTRYKETRWSLIVWNHSNRQWLLLPKSAFDSPATLDRCRELLSKHLASSTWFFS